MKRSILLLALSAVLCAQTPSPPVVNRVRFYPAPGGEQAMVGGQFAGSNVSPTEGFEVIATISSAPAAHEWTELTFENRRVYRWLRYVGPRESHSKIAEVEFYSGERKLSGPGNAYGSVAKVAQHSWQQAFDGKPESWFESHIADGEFVGVDLRDIATARTPALDPPAGEYPDAQRVALKCPTPGALIRYTLDGSTPTAKNGLLYSGPIEVKTTQTIAAVAFLEDRAPSPLAYGTYLIASSSKPGFTTFHLGNSLTQTTAQFARYAQTAGYRHSYTIFAMPGAPTVKLWNSSLAEEKERLQKTWNSVARVDQLTVQPRDFNVAEEADYCIRFFNLVREKTPEVQPWLYVEWTEAIRERPTDKGLVCPARRCRSSGRR
jgi:hypothetical protein